MAYNFPSSPTVGQVYQGYTWDGEKWAVAQSGGKTQRFIFTPAAGTTVLSGADANGLTLSYTPGAVEVSINGIWLDFSEYTATNGTSITLPFATAAGDRVYVYALAGFSVLDPLNVKKNYIVNGAMMVSQESGSTSQGPFTGTGTAYFVDQFAFIIASMGASMTIQQVASTTPGGSPNRIRATVTTADAAAPTSGEATYILQPIEGFRVADLLFGSSSAKSVTIRFGVRAPAGTYGVSLRNGSVSGGTVNRSCVAEFTISAGEANTDVIKTVTFSGDQVGTWAKDTSAGLNVSWCLLAGSTFQQAAGSFAATNTLTTSNQFNFGATNGNVFELFDVGLYEGVVAPSFTVPDFTSELALCQRYWEKSTNYAVHPNSGANLAGYTDISVGTATTSFLGGNSFFKVTKRTAPTIVLYDLAGAANKIFRGSNNQTPGTVSAGDHNFAHYGTGASASEIAFNWTANARM